MDDFHTEMASANVYPLWERESRHNRAPEAAHIWRWPPISKLLDRAVTATDMTNAERRVLVLRNPYLAEAGRDGAAINLAVNLQTLMPGETARPHRHTMNAIRFMLEGTGASTIVEGKDCAMHPGDMILTPAWTWHEHKHAGSARAVWVDALDVPIHTYLETGVFEAGPAHDVDELPRDAAFEAAGFAPDIPWGGKAVFTSVPLSLGDGGQDPRRLSCQQGWITPTALHQPAHRRGGDGDARLLSPRACRAHGNGGGTDERQLRLRRGRGRGAVAYRRGYDRVGTERYLHPAAQSVDDP